MSTTAKRCISLVLILGTLLSVLSPAAQAAPVNDATSVNTGDMTIQGTNDFGHLLSQEITQKQEESESESGEYPGGYTVTDLEITDHVATVTYDSMEEATLVVALYTEDGMQLLTSSSATVMPDETVATVTFEGEMPEYFRAAAYLLDQYDYSPLCAAFETPMYTREMQQLLDSTIHDYAPENVLNLDEDETTNFAVFADSTILIEPVEDKNTVASADDENAVYIIKNADEQITNLKKGDVFAYSYGENEMLILKVGSITVSGTTVTITGADLEMEEVFSALKLENSGTTEEFTMDDSICDEGVEYIGLQTDEGINPNVFENENEQTRNFGFTIEREIGTHAKVSGYLGLKFSTSLKYYISYSHQYIHYETTSEFGGNLYLDVQPNNAAVVALKLGYLAFSPIPGVYISFEPQLVLEFTARLDLALKGFKFTRGYTYETGIGTIPLEPTPKWLGMPELTLQGMVFVGLELTTNIVIVSKKILRASLKPKAGLMLTGTLQGKEAEFIENLGQNQGVKHDCHVCIKLELDARAEFKIEFEIFSHTIRIRAVQKIYKLSTGYYSLEFLEFGIGTCPHKSYRLTVQIQDENKQPCSTAVIQAAGEEYRPNEEGITEFYLPSGEHTVSCDWGGETSSKTIAMIEPKKLTFVKGEAPVLENVFDGNFGSVDDTGYIGYGICGDDAVWKLLSNGRMVISGIGDVTIIDWSDFKNYITSLEVENGITSICDNAFSGCTALEKITIADSVTTLGVDAFNKCTVLREVTMPCDLQMTLKTGHHSNYESPFTNCTNVRTIHYTYGRTGIMPNRTDSDTYDVNSYRFTLEWKSQENLRSVTFDEGITHIADYAFLNCASLTEAVIPSTVDSFGNYAFSGCISLQNIAWPDEIAFLGANAFENCSSFTQITIPDNLTIIRDNTFYGCIGLTELVIPDSVTNVGLDAFNGCTGLREVTMPCDLQMTLKTGYYSQYESPFTDCEKVRTIHYTYGRTGTMLNRTDSDTYDVNSYQFTLEWKSRNSLQKVIFDEGITHIGDYAFIDCNSLTEAVIPSTVDSIGHYAFSGCKSLKNINWPEKIVFLGAAAFQDCQAFTQIELSDALTVIYDNTFSGCISLASVEVPDSVTNLGLNAFNGCTSLREVTIPCDVGTSLITGYYSNYESPFTGCTNVRTIHYTYGRTGIMPNRTNSDAYDANCYRFTLAWQCHDRLSTVTFEEGITEIGTYALYGSTRLSSVTLPSTLDVVGDYSFAGCTALKELVFVGDMPIIDNNAFKDDTITCYYPDGNDTWIENYLLNYGGTITWKAYTLNKDGEMVVDGAVVVMDEPELMDVEEIVTVSLYQAPSAVNKGNEQIATPDAVFDGEYSTEITDGYALKTASFTDLAAGQQYVLLALKSIDVDDPLAADNLLFIDQAAANEDGTLRFVYIQRENAATSYVVACGASNKNLEDAEIIFPEMYYTGDLQAVDPVVVYDSETLVEGVDYTVVGTVSFTDAGEYTCYIRGIRDYTGLVECTYTVADHKHSYTNYISDGNATCTQDGTKTAKCDHCETTDTISDEGSALGHAFGAWVMIKEPTTAEDGIEEHTCTRCGHNEQRTIAKRENPFTDVAAGSFYYEPVMWAIENGITNGTSATTFGPNDQCMRAHVVTFLWRAVGSPEPTTSNNPFVDVKPTDFYYKPVLWALENGITSGMDATHFGPTSYCNRAQVVTFLYRTMGNPEISNTANPFTDVAAGSFYEKPVLWAVENGITNGLSATSFGPNAICNRAQIVTFLYRAFN